MQSNIDLDTFESTFNYQTFSIELTDGTVFDLIPNGNSEKVGFDNRSKFAELAVKARLSESDMQIEALKKGLFKIIPHSLIKCKYFI